MIEEVRNGQSMPPMAGLQVAQPLNDVQLVSLVASNLMDSMTTPKEAVAKACDIVVQAAIQANTAKLSAKLKLAQANGT